MKKLLRESSFWVLAAFLFGFAVFKPSDALAQCPVGTSQYPGGTVAGPTTATTTTISTCNFYGEYSVVSGIFANNNYVLGLSGGGTVTIYTTADVLVTFGAAPLSWTPATSGTYKFKWASGSCGTDASCHTTSVQLVAPATPPTPTQNAGTPTCPTGATLTVSGTPATGTQWYWQTSATGTSTATAYSGPYTVYTNATYYIRTFNSASNLWSAASSVTVSNVPVATPPPAPTAAENPTCTTTGTTLSEAAAPAGYAYYWQGTNATGSSTANPATVPYPVNATGTYYVSAYETATQCWSNGVGLLVTANSVIPGVPTANPNVFNFCTTSTPMNIAVNPALSPGPQCSVTASASGTDNTGVTATVTNFTCNPGTLVGVTMNASIGGTCPAWYYYSIVVNGVTVATQQCNQTGFNLTPYMPLTSVSIVSADNPNDNFGDFVNMNLSVNLTYAGTPYDVVWFSQPTSPNTPNLGTGATLNALGTSVMPTATNGSYSFYAGSMYQGCPSSSRALVTANVSTVNAVINPLNITCNGALTGSFSLGTVSCGTQPFMYSVNGGAYAAIPTNLPAGTHTVQIRDANNNLSSLMNLVITQPTAPTALTANPAYFSTIVGWTAQGSETSWVIEWGATGFTPGTGVGTSISPATNPDTITGLEANTTYQYYVAAGCTPGSAWAGPFTFSTDPGFFTWDNQCGPGFMDISSTGTALNLTDDGTATVTPAFPLNVQGSIGTSVTVSNNGWVSYTGTNGFVGLDVFSVDLDDEEGNVYHQSMTVNGEDLFIVQWDNRPRFSGVVGQNVTFQVIVNNTTNEIFYLYQDVVFGGTQSTSDYGAQSLIQAAGPNSTETVSSYNSTYLTNNSCVRFYNALCPNPSNLVVTPSEIDATLTWDAGLYGETEWTVIYGPAGFDPANYAAEGGFINTVVAPPSPTVTIGPLSQNTSYDVYVYSECAFDSLTSDGLMASFITQPFCSNPTALTAATSVDSLKAAWDWTVNADYSGNTVSSFNFQYGNTGFVLNGPDGITQSANGTNNEDTLINAPFFLAGGVYQYYLQAVCSTDSVSAWVGPITFTMPLSNDLSCGAEILPLDGVARTFNNTGATVSTGEGAIAPSATGAQTTTGWINSTVNGSVWFKFTAPASGNVRVNATGINYNGQAAIYSVNDCSNFSTFALLAANDNAIGSASLAPNFTICGLTGGTTYYMMFDGFNNTPGLYSLALSGISLEAGTTVTTPATLNICSGSSADLFTTITGQQPGGFWSSNIPAVNVSITDSTLNTSGLGYGVYDLQYRVTDGCAYDSVLGKVKIFAPSNAGANGSITACLNQPINLITGLTGNADLNGTWYTPSGAATSNGSYATAPGFQGNYNYTYIAGNTVCPNDTALVVVNVVNTCNWLDIEEKMFAGVEVFPNPSAGIVFITSDINFSYEVTDANGRIITTAQNGVKAAQKTEINLSNVETGVYFIRLNNEDAQKTYRIVIN